MCMYTKPVGIPGSSRAAPPAAGPRRIFIKNHRNIGPGIPAGVVYM